MSTVRNGSARGSISTTRNADGPIVCIGELAETASLPGSAPTPSGVLSRTPNSAIFPFYGASASTVRRGQARDDCIGGFALPTAWKAAPVQIVRQPRMESRRYQVRRLEVLAALTQERRPGGPKVPANPASGRARTTVIISHQCRLTRGAKCTKPNPVQTT
jgi:hypothetical protein